MFCPPGNNYNWDDLLEFSFRWASVLNHLESQKIDGHSFNAEDAERFHDASRLMRKSDLAEDIDVSAILDIQHAWLLANFMQVYPPNICSPRGEVLRAAPSIYTHADKIHWCPWEWDVEDSPYFSRIYKSYFLDHGEKSPIFQRFPFIDSYTGTIRLKNNSMNLLNSALDLGGNAEVGQRIFDHSVAPFIGWSIFWEAENIPSEWLPLLKIIGRQEDAAFFNDTDSPTPERTSTIAAEKRAVTEIVRRFDENKLQSKLLEQKEFTNSTGFKLSIRGFQRAWAEARAQRPDMGKPGPKS